MQKARKIAPPTISRNTPAAPNTTWTVDDFLSELRGATPALFLFASLNYSCEAENWHAQPWTSHLVTYQILAHFVPISPTYDQNMLTLWKSDFWSKNFSCIFGYISPREGLNEKPGLANRRFRGDMTKTSLKAKIASFDSKKLQKHLLLNTPLNNEGSRNPACIHWLFLWPQKKNASYDPAGTWSEFSAL